MRQVIGVELVAVMADGNGNEEYVNFKKVPEDQKPKLEEELLVFRLLKHITLAKKKSGYWEPIYRAISRLEGLV